MDADEKQFAVMYPKFTDHGDAGLPLFLDEIDRKPAIVKNKIVMEVKGKIAEGDAKVKTPVGLLPAKRFEVRLHAGKQYRLTMDGEDLDSFLVLQDKSGKELAIDDDGGGGMNSLLMYTPPGDDSFTVFAAAIQNQTESKNTGPFELKIVEIAHVDDAKEKRAKRQANAAVVLLRKKKADKKWPLMKRGAEPDDPRLRSYLIHRFGPLGAEAKTIVKQLNWEHVDLSIQRALILSLGEYGEKDLPTDDRDALTKKLKEWYSTTPDPGLHAATEWLLRTWKQESWLKQVNEDWAQDGAQREKKIAAITHLIAQRKEKTPPQWFVNGQGQTMVVITGPVTFAMGSPTTEANRRKDERQHNKRIGRTFAIASKSVTIEQFQNFDRRYHTGEAKHHRMADLPVVGTSWNHAAAYCNWLSEKEGIDEKEWCFEIKGPLVKLREGYLSLLGYRVPTRAEMEYATRAGAVTCRYYGETEELLSKYAWYMKNSKDLPWPVGTLKPNDLGLFDALGNVHTWCLDWGLGISHSKGDEVYDEEEQKEGRGSRVIRGGSFQVQGAYVRSADSLGHAPTGRSVSVGFRVARTWPLDGKK